MPELPRHSASSVWGCKAKFRWRRAEFPSPEIWWVLQVSRVQYKCTPLYLHTAQLISSYSGLFSPETSWEKLVF